MPDPSLFPDDRDRVARALAANRDRVFAVDGAAGRLWVKRPRQGPGRVHHALASLGAACIGLKLLRPAAVSVGPEALVAEARRLRRLARAGWPVPVVCDVTPERLVLSDNGEPIARRLGAESDQRRRRGLLEDALGLLARLHAAGAWHGAAQARNFTRCAGGIGLIDFEDEIEPVMPLADRQGRDVVLLLLSAARYLDADGMTALARAARAATTPDARAAVDALAARVAPLHRVAGRLVARLGRDGAAMAAMFDALDAAR